MKKSRNSLKERLKHELPQRIMDSQYIPGHRLREKALAAGVWSECYAGYDAHTARVGATK
jgi:hypothetical protein